MGCWPPMAEAVGLWQRQRHIRCPLASSTVDNSWQGSVAQQTGEGTHLRVTAEAVVVARAVLQRAEVQLGCAADQALQLLRVEQVE